MTNEEKNNKILDCLKEQSNITSLKVDNINHRPHPYCITEKHITGKYITITEDIIKQLEKENKASCGMYVKGDKCINGYKSGYTKCNIPYEEHTYNTVAFISLIKDTSNIELNDILKSLVDSLGTSFIDGFVFVKSKFNII